MHVLDVMHRVALKGRGDDSGVYVAAHTLVVQADEANA
jgi:hypothetical protein